MQKVVFPGIWRTGRRIAWISFTEYFTILFGVEGGGLGAYCIAFWDLHYGEMVFVSSWISTYWDIACDIGDQMGAQLVYLDGYLLGFVFLVI